MSVTFSARANYKLLILNNGEQGEKCNNVRMRFVASLPSEKPEDPSSDCF